MRTHWRWCRPAAAQLRTGMPQRKNSDSPRLFERSADSVAVSAELSYAAGIQSASLVTFWAQAEKHSFHQSYSPAGAKSRPLSRVPQQGSREIPQQVKLAMKVQQTRGSSYLFKSKNLSTNQPN